VKTGVGDERIKLHAIKHILRKGAASSKARLRFLKSFVVRNGVR